MSKKIILLCSDCFSTVAEYNYLKKYFNFDALIVEQPVGKKQLIKRRIKKLGFFKVAGQVLFSLLIVPVLNKTSGKRIAAIKKLYKFDETPLDKTKIINVSSVNDIKCIDELKRLSPDIVIVNGTRIISKNVLDAVKAVFINMHTGITPQYRGVHGGYWAMVNNDAAHFGVTVHLVDKGIDTGNILYQATAAPCSKDNFITYPFLQFGEGIPLVKKAIDDVIQNKLNPMPYVSTNSKLWSHPSLWQYLSNRIFRSIK
jgi:folate-dependent phosphoribosylglycinamide formyltransferase PurN